jgi:catechol 2,3-dioxygenase-like lactoylglutathione lyase family enzyme
MKHHLTGLDHPVIGVRDMDAARAAYERLGFIVPPRGKHPEWGTGNWCIQFADDYLELRGIVAPTAAPQARELVAFLQRREGLMGIAFGTTRAQATHDSLLHAGLQPRPVKPLTRDFELPDGTVPVSFQLCFLPREETPGLMHVVICEHVTPERLRRPEWLQHPNGARRVAGLVAIAEQPEMEAARWAKLFPEVTAVAGGIRSRVGRGELLLLSPAAFHARYPGETLPPRTEWPCLGAVVLGVEDIARSRDWLVMHNVGRVDGTRVIARPELACGALLEFADSSIVD